MPIFFALLILAFAVHSIVGIQNSADSKIDNRTMAADILDEITLQKKLGILAKQAFDVGRNYDGACPTGHSPLSQVGPSGIHLCWSDNSLTGRCFRDVTFKGRQICISSDQYTLSSNGGSTTGSTGALYAQILAPQQASAVRGPREPTAGNMGIYTGIHNPSAVPAVSGGNNATARVRFPAAEAGNLVSGNRINCTMEHTECFTIVYCLDGTLNCTGRNRFSASFAARYF